jgi:hypothetical protein
MYYQHKACLATVLDFAKHLLMLRPFRKFITVPTAFWLKNQTKLMFLPIFGSDIPSFWKLNLIVEFVADKTIDYNWHVKCLYKVVQAD